MLFLKGLRNTKCIVPEGNPEYQMEKKFRDKIHGGWGGGDKLWRDFFFFVFLGPYLRHLEVPRLGD